MNDVNVNMVKIDTTLQYVYEITFLTVPPTGSNCFEINEEFPLSLLAKSMINAATAGTSSKQP